jgi:transposase
VLGTENRNLHYKAFYSDTPQQILTTIAESFKSFVGLLKGIKEGAVTQRPRLPNYRQGGMALVTYTGRSVKPRNGLLKFPLGSKVKAWFGLDAFYLPKPSNLDYKAIREYPILPINRQFYVEFVYKAQSANTDIDTSRALGIDPGLNNWLTCVSNVGTSLIVD